MCVCVCACVCMCVLALLCLCSTLPMNDLGESQVQLLTAVDFDALQKHFSELQARHTLASRPTYRRMVS